MKNAEQSASEVVSNLLLGSSVIVALTCFLFRDQTVLLVLRLSREAVLLLNSVSTYLTAILS